MKSRLKVDSRRIPVTGNWNFLSKGNYCKSNFEGKK